MDVGELIQGGGLILSGAAVVKIADALAKVWAARNQKTEVVQPLEVKGAPSYVTCEACRERHAEVEKRLEDGTRAFDAIRAKMDADHRDVIQGINKLNDRMVPLVETCAENGAAIRILLGENLNPRPKK